MLRERISSFLYNLPPVHPDSEKLLVRTILLYAMGQRDAEHLRALSRHLGITEEWYEFKAEYLDRSYYTISQFWRLTYEYFKRIELESEAEIEQSVIGEVTKSRRPVLASTAIDRRLARQAVKAVKTILPDQRRDCVADLLLLEDHLDLEDHQRLHTQARANQIANPSTPTDFDLKPIIDKLRRYCWRLAYVKTRFIPQNDCGVTLDDIAIELFEVGLRTLREFDHETNKLKLINTAKVGIRNHCNRLIDFYTAQKRSRVVRLEDGEYQATTISLDHELPSEHQYGSTRTILDTIETEDEMQDDRIGAEQWLADLLRATSPSVRRVIEITLGHDDPEFDRWVLQRKGKDASDLNETTLARCACEFMETPIADVRRLLRRNKTIASAISINQAQALAYA